MTDKLGFPETFHDKFIKFTFDNIRNVLISAPLLTAAIAIGKYKEKLPFGECWNIFLFIFIALVALALLGWNMIHGGCKVAQIWKIQRRWYLLGYLLLFALYGTVVFASAAALMHLRAVSQGEQTHSFLKSHSNIAFNTDAPKRRAD